MSKLSGARAIVRGTRFARARTGFRVVDGSVFEKASRLPARLTRMVGRDGAIQEISGRLATDRFVSIIGPGGIGKTAVAVSVGHRMLSEFDGAVSFFNLGPLDDRRLVPGAVASALGLQVQANDSIPRLINFVRDKRILLIFDNCEHVIDTVATLAERIFQEAPQVHILATSREALRVEGEHVLRLPPLEAPPDDPGLTAAQALGYPAVQLFVERMAASGQRYEMSDLDAPVVGRICRRLDDPLAIELVASRVVLMAFVKPPRSSTIGPGCSGRVAARRCFAISRWAPRWIGVTTSCRYLSERFSINYRVFAGRVHVQAADSGGR